MEYSSFVSTTMCFSCNVECGLYKPVIKLLINSFRNLLQEIYRLYMQEFISQYSLNFKFNIYLHAKYKVVYSNNKFMARFAGYRFLTQIYPL